MPAFQMPTSSAKRKLELSEEESVSRKRISLDLNSRSLPDGDNEVSRVQEQVWMVQWRNPQHKKHKTWDGDGILTVNGTSEALLYDSDGQILARGKVTLPLCEGRNLSVASKEVELERTIPRNQFLSGLCFGRAATITIASPSVLSNAHIVKKFIPPSSNSLGPSGHPVKFVHKLELEDESMPTSNNEGLSNITNQPSSHWTANWRKPQGKKNKTWDGDAYVSHVADKLIMISEDGKIMGSTSWKGQTLSPGFSTSIAGKDVELDNQVSASQLPTIQGSEVFALGNPSDGTDTVPPNSTVDQKIVPSTTFYAPAPPKVKGPLYDSQAPDAVVMKSPTKEHMRKFNKRNLPVVPVILDPILSRKMRPHQKEGLMFLYESVMGLRKHEGQGCILADEMGLGKTLQTIALVWTLIKQNPYAGPLPVVQKVLIVCPVSLVGNWKAEFHKWLGRDRVGIIACDRNSDGIDIFGRSKVHQVLIIGYERLRTVVTKLEELHPPIGLIICDEGHRLKSANNKTAAVFKTLSSRRRIILSGTPIQNDLGEFHAMAEFCNPGLLDDYSVFRKVYENPILKSRTPDASPKEVELGEARTEQLLSIARSFVLRRDATLLKTHLPPKSEYVVFITPTVLQLSMFHKILHPDKLNDLIQSSTAESLALINILTKISNSPILLKATADNVKNRKSGAVDPVRRGAVDDALDLLPTKAHIADMSLSGKLLSLATMLKMIRQNTSEKCVLVSHYTSTLNILEAYCRKSSYSYYRLDGQTPQNKRQEYVNAFNRESQHNSFIFLLSSKAGGVGINLIGASRLFIIDSDWNPRCDPIFPTGIDLLTSTSHDLQSMARCHRDGQKRPVFIYRFLTAGAIDEKIYQRQVTKLALSDSLIGSGTMNSKSDSFTRKDVCTHVLTVLCGEADGQQLRDIFRIHMDTGCNTHDLLECACDSPDNQIPDDFEIEDGEDLTVGQGFVAASELRQEKLDAVDKAYLQKKKAGLAALGEWTHINCLTPSGGTHIQDDILRKIVSVSTDGNSAKAGDTQLETILSAVDIDAIRAMDKQRSVRDVPGGTIAFLFEKCSETVLVNSEDEDT
ncbi:hypothetical protein BYT27DRAFT_7334698 [Phlegmacium glaucopus]|nr:hypothetical protein BYT27DRAFT_7334698 [Phlegmacium glaucopus]